MLYVMQFSFHEGLSREQRDEAMMRRAQWQYPAGLKMVAEYWLSGNSPTVIVVAEAETYEPIMEVGLNWGDLFDIKTAPATTFESGMQMGQAIMARRST